ncbi:VOC family protein [Streptomyces sp. NPDC052299]|uniref:VOC family protein n=1 Tax=Streptomyces sp. NPDC052299 TaxID=3155054 RepID=UPI00342AD926
MLTGIVIDACDVRGAARFWADATRGRTGGLRLRFERCDRPKPAHKNRLHLDLAGGPDWEAEAERLLALGATRTDIGQGDVPWDVLADPEGNEFCLLRPGHPGVRAGSGLVAVCLDVTEEERDAQRDFWASWSGWPVEEDHDRCVRLRRTPDAPVSFVMGPPAAPRAERDRMRLDVRRPGVEPGAHRDPGGNTFHVGG